MAPYTILSGPAQAAKAPSGLHMKPPQEPEPDQAVENQEDRYHEIEQPRHDQDQEARENGQDRRDMGNGEGHGERLR